MREFTFKAGFGLHNESLDIISIAQLRREGLFVPGPPRRSCTVTRDEIEVTATFEREYKAVTFKMFNTPLSPEWIYIDTQESIYSQREYFICPATGKRVNELYVLYNNIWTRHDLRFLLRTKIVDNALLNRTRARELATKLLGDEERGPARGANKLKILTELKALDYQTLLPPEYVSAIELALLRGTPRRRKPALSQGVGLAAAAGAAGYVSPSLVYQRLRGQQAKVIHSGIDDAVAGCALLGRPSSIIDQAQMNVFDLLRIWADQGDVLTLALDWRAERTKSLMYGFSWPDGQRVLLVENERGGVITHQTIIITYGEQAAPKPTFNCPVFGTACETLYLREGRFGCRKAQRLTYPSERV